MKHSLYDPITKEIGIIQCDICGYTYTNNNALSMHKP